MTFFEAFQQFDGNLLIGIQHALNADWLTPIMKAINMFGEKGLFFITLCVVLIACKKTRKIGIICSASLLLAFVLCNLTIKPLVMRIRPWVTFPAVNAMLPPPGDASFPSGHATDSIAPAWAFYLSTRAEGGKLHIAGIALVILSLLIALSRLYLGMHYPSDVICGLLLGILCATIVWSVYKKISDKRLKITDK